MVKTISSIHAYQQFHLLCVQLTCLFWNTSASCPDAEISSLVNATGAQIIALAEYSGDGASLLREMAAGGHDFYLIPQIGCERIMILTGFSPTHVSHRREADRYTIKEIFLPGMLRLLLCVTHLPSKLHSSDVDQLHTAMYMKQDIELAEIESEHTNTVVVGDFNMNPFDDGMVSAAALNSVPCLVTSQRETRTIDGRKHSFFYNPMWNLLGDFSGPPGTYFHSSPGYRSDYWHTIDQVVVRPSLAARLQRDKLAVLTKAGANRLISDSGRPIVSDHFPITFSVDLNWTPA